MWRKYIKINSLTWWAAVAPLVAGIIVATEPLHHTTGLVATINNLTGHAAPALLINAGMGAIGLRGAL